MTTIELDIDIPEGYQAKLNADGKAQLRVPKDGELFLSESGEAARRNGNGIVRVTVPRLILEKIPPKYRVAQIGDFGGVLKVEGEAVVGKYIQVEAFTDAMTLLMKSSSKPWSTDDKATYRALRDVFDEVAK